MILFKILQEFLVPSVFVLVLILIGIILIFRKKRGKLGRIFLILGILLYYLFSITPVADLVLAPLENQYQPVQKEELNKADKIVLLLGGKESDFLRASEVLKILKIKYQKSKIIISGTDPLNPQREEAKEVKEFLAERGIPAENIILEEKSRTTKESAQNLKELLAKEPFFLVTSAYHMPRAMETFEKAGLNSVPAPIDFKAEKSYDILDFFPDAQNLRNCDLAFHEYFGIVFYKIF
jgi:uncharacterized SAM-binding protein YcdF (DUF218 family)